MAGGNPTAWRGALPRQATPRAGHGTAPSSQDGGSPAGCPSAAPGWPGTAASPARVCRCAMAEWSRTRLPWAAVAIEEGAVEPLVVGADLQRLAGPSTRPRRRTPTRRTPRRRAAPSARPSASISASVPSKTAQSVRLQPREEGAPDQPHGRDDVTRVVAGGQRREALDVGRHRVDRSCRSTPRGRCARPSAVAAECPAGIRGRRVRGGRRHRTLGPHRQRPLGVAHAMAVEGQVDHELESGRTLERCGGAGHLDRAEHRNVDAVVAHAGERSATDTRGGGGIRTLTGDGLSALPLPVGLRPLGHHS